MLVSAILAVGLIGVGLWLARRAGTLADAAEWAASHDKDEVATDLNEWAVGFHKLAVAAYAAAGGLMLGHLLWPSL